MQGTRFGSSIVCSSHNYTCKKLPTSIKGIYFDSKAMYSGIQQHFHLLLCSVPDFRWLQYKPPTPLTHTHSHSLGPSFTRSVPKDYEQFKYVIRVLILELFGFVPFSAHYYSTLIHCSLRFFEFWKHSLNASFGISSAALAVKCPFISTDSIFLLVRISVWGKTH